MTNPIHPAEVYIKDTGTIKGRGVFASRDFSAGDLVEVCPVIILLRPYNQLPPRLKTMVFSWGNLTNTSPSSALALGFGSLYNHDNPANLRYQAMADDEVLHYIAVDDIKKDDELTINYNTGGGSPTSDNDSWFEQRGIELLS